MKLQPFVVKMIKIAMCSALFVGSPLLRAQELPKDGQAILDVEVRDRVMKWQKLQQIDPKSFSQMVSRKKIDLGLKLQRLKESNPKKYETLKNSISSDRKRRLQNLRDHHPKVFRKHTLRQVERLNTLKAANPEAFKRWTDNVKLVKDTNRVHGTVPKKPLRTNRWKMKHPFHGKAFTDMRRRNTKLPRNHDTL